MLALLFSLIPVNSVKAENNFVFNKNLTSGTIHSDVLQLQKFLNTHGFVVATSGAGSLGHETTKFGSATKKALIKFQIANKINPAVGYFGLKTRGVLNKINGGVNSFFNLPAGCTSAIGYSSTTGFSCLTGLPISQVPKFRMSGSVGVSSPSSDATLNLGTMKVKGETLIFPGIPDTTLLGPGLMPGFVVLTKTEADNTSNVGSFITSFVPTNAKATTKVVVYNNPITIPNPTTFETDTAYNGTDAISNGGVIIIKVTAEDHSVLYYGLIVEVQAVGTVAAVEGTSTITYTLTTGTFDTVGGIDIGNWVIGGDDGLDLGNITNVVLSAGDTVATITIDGAVGVSPRDYTITPSLLAISAGFAATAPETPVTIAVPTEITSFDALSNVDGGAAGSGANYANAAAVITVLPVTVAASPDSITVPVTTWVDTDTYNATVAGSYTFTATLGIIPPGYANTGGYTATVEVILTPSITSSTYDAATGDLVLTGTGFDTGSTIDVTKFTITGQGPTCDLTVATANPTPASLTTATVIIAGADKTCVDAILDTNGIQASGLVFYNIAATAGWQTISSVQNLADATTPITVSNASVAVVSSATTIDKNTIRIQFNKPLTAGSHASANGFTVTGALANGPITVTNVALGGGGPSSPFVTLTLDNDITFADLVQISYDSDIATVKLTGANGDVVSFGPYGVTNNVSLEDVTSAVFTTTVATTTITITLAEGSFKAGPIVAGDFIFGGPNATAIAANGIFDRTDAAHVAITGLSGHLSGNTDNDNTITVLGEAQTAQVITVTAVAS